jgi:hypothetical protein
LTPDTVETELLGTLEFFDGMPSDETVKKPLDLLDTSRAAEAFLTGMPATSIYAMLEGMKQAGANPGDLVLWENYGDARTLALTFNTSTLYATAEINVKDEPAIVDVPPAPISSTALLPVQTSADRPARARSSRRQANAAPP